MRNFTNSKTLFDLFEQFSEVLMTSINCMKIGTIQSFDPLTQTATVEIAVKRTKLTNDDVSELQPYPLLVDVPVVFLSGGTAHLTFPITAGDSCIVIFNDFEKVKWFTTGTVQPTITDRQHDLSDGVAIVGLRNMQNLIQNFSETVELAFNETSKINVGAENITLDNAQTNATGNLTVSGNTDSATYSTGGTAGITIQVVEIHDVSGATKQTLTFTNGLLTQVS